MREFVESLNARGVDYAIVGGFAGRSNYFPSPRMKSTNALSAAGTCRRLG
jgi:hypothetical protein